MTRCAWRVHRTYEPCDCGLLDSILTIEAEARTAALTDLRAKVEGLKQPTLGLAGGVSRARVLALIDEALR